MGKKGIRFYRSIVGYGIAVTASAAIAALRFSLQRLLGLDAALIASVLGIAAAASFGGFGPGLLATALSVLIDNFYFVEPVDHFAVAELPYQVRFIVFGMVGLAICGLSARLHAALQKVRQAQAALLDREAELQRLNADLERRQAERESLLASERAARGEAERANRMKDQFVATVSHELRTPLNAILGWTHILQKSKSPDFERGLSIIERNTRLQAQLISDLLDISRIASGKLRLDLQHVDLPHVIVSALDAARPAAEAKEITLRQDITQGFGPVLGDPGRLQQVIGNLLSNALKFTPSGGEVKVSLAPREGYAEIVVSDTGQGIAPAFLPHLFERFRQADASAARQHGGLGLGLAIVKSLVEMHGGEVSVESAGPGKGSTFKVSLPLEARAASGEALGSSAPLGTSALYDEALVLDGLGILVVDDEPDACEFMRRVLGEAGARVRAVRSAREALEALDEQEADLMVSDIGMPEMDGYALMREIRARRARRAHEAGELYAIAVTAFARPEDRDEALAAGYRDYLAKPVEPSVLIATVARLAARKVQVGRGAPAAQPILESRG